MGIRRSRIYWLLGPGVALLLLLLVSIGAVASTSGASPGAAKAHRLAAQPNIIVIESDDQPTIAFNHHAMPKTFQPPATPLVSRFRSSSVLAANSVRTSESKDTSDSLILVPLEPEVRNHPRSTRYANFGFGH